MRVNARLKLPAAVYALGATSLLNDAASDMIYPLLPIFLATSVGAGPAALGVIEGAAEAMASFLRLAAGFLSDRMRRRKPFVVVGYVIASAARPLIGLARSAGGVLVVRLIDRFGKGLRSSPRDALIADVVPPAARARAFGVHEAMDHAGAVAGPLVASALLGWGVGMRSVFLASVVPGVLGCLAVSLLVREPEHLTVRAAPFPDQSRAAQGPRPRLLNRAFVGYLTAVTFFALGSSSDAFLVLRAYQAGLSAASVAQLWALHNLIKALSTAWGGQFADRIGRRRALALGWVAYAAVYAGFAWVDTAYGMVGLFAAYGLHYALVGGAQKALVADLVPPEARARGYGAYHMCVGLALLPASLLFGVVYQHPRLGAPYAFGAGALLALIAAALLPLSRPRHA